MTTKEAKESILEIQVIASLVGHDLGPFEPLETFSGGYGARCRNCNLSAWVGESELRHLLKDRNSRSQSIPKDRIN